MFGLELTEMEPKDCKEMIPHLMLSLMQIADQAKILHWQTDYDTEHRHFGSFYETFIEHMDNLVEAIAGKYGKDSLRFGEAAISICDYGMARNDFFETVEMIMRDQFCQIFNKESDSELFNLADEILDLKNKTQYLLQLK
jgi:DNA-binding ferritin-like protein